MTPAKAESGERAGRPDLHVRLNLKVGTMQMQCRAGEECRRGAGRSPTLHALSSTVVDVVVDWSEEVVDEETAVTTCRQILGTG